MASARLKTLACTHLAVLGLGAMLGLRGSWEAGISDPPLFSSSPASSETSTASRNTADPSSGASSEAPRTTAAEYAAAWNSLKGRFLPRQQRLLIEKSLLEEWSVLDLAAAVRAVFEETTDQGPNGFGEAGILHLLECCAPGIRAAPAKAWELVRSNAFGLETGRFRRQWLDCIAESDPASVFSILGELPGNERFDTLGSFAVSSCTADDPKIRDAIWTGLSALPDSPEERQCLSNIGNAMCYYIKPEELVTRLRGELSPAGKRICISSLSLALFEVVEHEDFPKPLFLLPDSLRGEVAAAGLKYGGLDEEGALLLANVALDSGNLDALQAAAEDPGFARFAKEMKQPLPLADWALRLPEDPRTVAIFRQAIEGAASNHFEDSDRFSVMQKKLQSLSPGWQRDQGLATLAKMEEEERRRKEAENAEDAMEEDE